MSLSSAANITLAADTCKVYQNIPFFGNESNRKALVLTRAFNENGNVSYEIAKGYVHYADVDGRSMIDVLQDGKYFYQYSGNKLIRTIRKYLDDETDSIEVDYTYNRKGKLDTQIEKLYAYPYIKTDGTEESRLDTSKPKAWGRPDTTAYYYYPQNDSLFEMKSFYNGKVTSTKHLYQYDTKGRVLKDSITITWEYGDYYTSKSNLQYRYDADSTSRRHCDNDGCVLYTSRVNGNQQVLRESYFNYNKEGVLKFYSKTEYTYDDKNRIVKSKYFVGETLTTTHEFVYK